jgi:ATP-dependent Zn protease
MKDMSWSKKLTIGACVSGAISCAAYGIYRFWGKCSLPNNLFSSKSVKGKITIDYNNEDIPHYYIAIFEKIAKLINNDKITSITLFEKKEKGLLNNILFNSSDSSFSDSNYYIDAANKDILVDEKDQIYVSFKAVDKYNSQIVLYSYELSAYALKKIVDKWIQDYDDEKKEESRINKNLCYFYSVSCDDEKLRFKTHTLDTYKNFNNIHFTQKEMMLKKLNFFLENQDLYKKRGIPYNFGLLFHGPPGCGKSSCIKAIAKYTNRSVIDINLKNIKTCDEFIQVFTTQYMNDIYLPTNKKIIILEDIDCMSNIVKDRKESDEDEDTNALTLSCILNTIDGILEQTGRIMIMTTNHPEKLDDALTRSGRIDLKINFTKCTQQMYKDIIESYYDEELTEDIVFPEDTYSPANVLEICAMSDNIEDAIKTIVSKEFGVISS